MYYVIKDANIFYSDEEHMEIYPCETFEEAMKYIPLEEQPVHFKSNDYYKTETWKWGPVYAGMSSAPDTWRWYIIKQNGNPEKERLEAFERYFKGD